jgi:circadian clock protein KaiB
VKRRVRKGSAARKPRPGLPGKLKPPRSTSRQATYVLRLYVSGSTRKSARAIENIKRICERHLKNRYDLEVIDVYQQPNLAKDDRIVAVPTLIKRLPAPQRRLIGDLSNTAEALFGLGLGTRDHSWRKAEQR